MPKQGSVRAKERNVSLTMRLPCPGCGQVPPLLRAVGLLRGERVIHRQHIARPRSNPAPHIVALADRLPAAGAVADAGAA